MHKGGRATRIHYTPDDPHFFAGFQQCKEGVEIHALLGTSVEGGGSPKTDGDFFHQLTQSDAVWKSGDDFKDFMPINDNGGEHGLPGGWGNTLKP